MTKVTLSRPADVTDTSMADAMTSVDTEWLKENMQQLMDNQAVMKKQLDAWRHQPVKMPAIEKFNRDWLKLKRFLTQIKIRIDNKGPKLATPFDKVIYAGMHLIEKPLKWFQPYLLKAQMNGVTTTN